MNILRKQLQTQNNIVIVKYDNAGYTLYSDNTLKNVIACVYTQKNQHGVIIYDENMTIKQVKTLVKQYKKMNCIIK